MTGTNHHQVTFFPEQVKIEIESGITLLAAAQKAGVGISAVCGGTGSCGTCRVKIISGDLNSPTPTEIDSIPDLDIRQGYRLACQAIPSSDVVALLDEDPSSLTYQFMVDGHDLPGLQLDPPVFPLDISATPPSKNDPQAGFTLVNEFLHSKGLPLLVSNPREIHKLSSTLDQYNWNARLVLNSGKIQTHLTAAYAEIQPILGLAMDVGTTKLALYLIDLESGRTLAQRGILNPQVAYGDDVISRIAFANQKDYHPRVLHDEIVNAINQNLAELCRITGLDTGNVVDVVAVGNTVMHHLLAGLPVIQLGFSPYVPATTTAMRFLAIDGGISVSPGAEVYLPPLVAGFIGCDHTAALLTVLNHKASDKWVLIDIGTNTEISLMNEGKIFSCSTASGPAFEGAYIHNGMRASLGAIEKITIHNERIELGTIGNVRPRGICGTGLLNSIAEMLDAQIIRPNGSLSKNHPRVHEWQGKQAFILAYPDQTDNAQDILITNKDIRQIQLAKSAIRTGLNILFEQTGVEPVQIQDWYMAGAFGTHLDIASAIRIGLLPSVALNRTRQIGNAAGTGARALLLSRDCREDVEYLTRQITYLELTTYPGFVDHFVDSMHFPD